MEQASYEIVWTTGKYLKYGFLRFWSRHIDRANRMVYIIVEVETIYILSLKVKLTTIPFGYYFLFLSLVFE